MSTPHNVDQWMMDALDGHISKRDRVALEAYLAENPAERAAFRRMQQVDHALVVEPLVSAPKTLKFNVMAALPRPAAVTAQTPYTAPFRLGLSAPQAVFIALVAAMLVVVIGLGTISLVSVVSPSITLSGAVPPATASIVNAAGDTARTVVHAVVAFSRAIIQQPLFWIVVPLTMFISFLWARLVLLLLLPTLRFMLA